MRRAVELRQYSELGGGQATLPMGGSAALSGRAETGLPQEAAQGLAAQGETLDLAKFLAQVVIVEAGIGRAGQTDDGLPHSGGQAAGTGSSAIGVRPSGPPLLPKNFLYTLYPTAPQRRQVAPPRPPPLS